MKKLLLVGILHGLLCPLALMAQTVTITFNGVAIDNPHDAIANDPLNGYAINQEVSFSFVINDNAPNISTDYGSYISWIESFQSTSLFESIYGTGLSGTFTKPYDKYDSNQSEIYSNNSGGLTTQAFYQGMFNYGANMGIYANTHPIYNISFHADTSSLGFGYSDSIPEVSAYMSSYAGTYATTSSSADLTTDAGMTYFTINSVTISTTAVPEPSTYAALVGLLALGFVAVRRRRRG